MKLTSDTKKSCCHRERDSHRRRCSLPLVFKRNEKQHDEQSLNENRDETQEFLIEFADNDDDDDDDDSN